MALSADDRAAITDLINLHGHLCDTGRFDRMDEIFSADVVYDTRDVGGSEMVGLDAGADAARALGDANPVGHHVTNIVVMSDGVDRAHAVCKFIGVQTDGSVGSGTYEDFLERRPEGWRITHRIVRLRRVPLQP